MQDYLAPVGLYDPSHERDACGVGFICNINGDKSHAIVEKGLQILMNLEHRGACGCDALTGDGAGILMQLPERFLRKKAAENGFKIPKEDRFGVGMIFLPTDADERRFFMDLLEAVVLEEGQRVLGWREVPTNDEHLGHAAKESEPSMWQLYIGAGGDAMDAERFERKLYVIRKVAESRAAEAAGRWQGDYFYIASLSSRTLVYKGMLTTLQLPEYFRDLSDPLLESALAIVHSRFSTNTLPRWPLAHPFRFLAHNGEINTLRGNVNWMNTRQSLFHSERFGADTAKLLPVLKEGDSDSATLDKALELLYFTGRSLPHAMMMLVPEAWERHESMSAEKRAFYEYHSCLMEPWDGPATIPFTDGRYVGAMLDRNGLRPSRYWITRDGMVIMASETGVLEVDPSDIMQKGRLQPGRMFLVDLQEKRIIRDEEIKDQISRRRPYGEWLRENRYEIENLPEREPPPCFDQEERNRQQRLFGYTLEDMRMLLPPMITSGKEALGSMGDDTPLAVLSDRPRLLYDYFRQLFAQVTNPPLDAIREELVTSLGSTIGAEGDLFQETPDHCRQLHLPGPLLTSEELARVCAADVDGVRATTLPMLFEIRGGGAALEGALQTLCRSAADAIDSGHTILVLSDRGTDERMAPVPALLATAAVHHHLIRAGKRTLCGLVIESGEPREVHHFALLIGYGASAINPYLALETIPELVEQAQSAALETEAAREHYRHAVGGGILKVMSKMGISTIQSYQGAQIFEAVGVSRSVIDPYFTGTPSRIGGIDLDTIAEEVRLRHEHAFAKGRPAYTLDLEVGGRYGWRRNGEHHLFNPMTIARLQDSVRRKDPATYAEYAALVNDQTRRLATIRGMLDLKVDDSRAIPIDEVEPWTEIVRRFKTGAMSYGSISGEAHEALAVAMNTLGGRSNTGEGGEDPSRYSRESTRRSRIKQVASGRFGVTMAYLVSADEIQIKMAQGAKPGEGGQLPGEKVLPWIAKTRHSTPYVGLISPPPHHDIYSIEDLAQLIHDLKNANRQARISVKLVSEVGVGTVASGVAKGKADVVLISGHDGGTGASPQTSLAHAGLPWELGLAETHQALVRNGLRTRIRVECDGQLKTGRDVAVAALLGADEFGFATAPLVAMGCIMMRKCHLNTCPVGIATQNPVLRAKFSGQPEHVINYLHFVAEELREIMAGLGFRTVAEMTGQVDRLQVRPGITHWKARHLDLTPLLARPEVPEFLKPFAAEGQDHALEGALDHELIASAAPALDHGRPVFLSLKLDNTNRTLGTMLSAEVVRRHGEQGLPEDTIVLNGSGSAGQSFLAFGAPGLTARVEGDANDYVGKGLSGARIIIYPPFSCAFDAEDNVIIGNVALYGATSGEVFVRGRVGERFAVRNSGANAVVEGVGDHGCEYMTGGRVVVLGSTGRNFAAGMSGGVAYVLDRAGHFDRFCNGEMVDLLPVTEDADAAELKSLIEQHLDYTGSNVARWVLDHWEVTLPLFVKVYPREYRKALERLAMEEAASASVQPQMAAA